MSTMSVRRKVSDGPTADGVQGRRRVLAGLAAAFAVMSSRLAGASEQRAGEVRFGLTPVLLTSDLDLLSNLQSYMSGAISRPVKLITRRSYQEITALLLTGHLHAAWICGYPYVQYRDRLSLLAVPVWRGRPLYRSYLIVSADRRAEGVAELRGDIHAFSDPDSNSGHLVTQALLAEMGHSTSVFFRKHFFTYSHRDVVRAVAAGLAHSGSVDGYVWEVMSKTEPELTSKTRVLRQSEWLGFPPIACARAMQDDPAAIAVRESLLGMAHHPKGRRLLKQLHLDGFAAGDATLFDGIARKFELVKTARI